MSIEDQLKSFEQGEISLLMIMKLVETMAQQMLKNAELIVSLSHRVAKLEAAYSQIECYLKQIEGYLKQKDKV